LGKEKISTMRFFKVTITFLLAMLCFSKQSIAQQDYVKFFGLNQVRLLDSPFLQAQETNKRYILALDMDRLLAPFMKEAGLPWKVENYGNWENTGLDGHVGGHYLSALAMMYASTGDPEINDRLEYMLMHLKIAQNKHGNGYLGGIPHGQQMWEEIRNGQIKADNFSLNNRWVPLYNIHKIFAGFRDAYLIAGKEDAKFILINLSKWFLDLTSNFTEEQFQKILISEHGGLHEIFADVAQITGDPIYLELAKKMSHQAFLNPLTAAEDRLTGMHANTQIPKVIGFQRIYQLTQDTHLNAASEYFWDNVVNKRSVAIGGNSVREHFHSTNDFSLMLSSEQGPETCNTYNMMRLSEMLFQSSPDKKYIDYYERAVFNHILSTQHPEKGGFVYFTSMRPQHYRVYSQPHENFWCCVGSGLENHAKYGQVIYAHCDNDLYINLFIASELDWKEKGVKILQKTNFPHEEATTIMFQHKGRKKINLKIRNPYWVKQGTLKVYLNGKEQEVTIDKFGYVSMSRNWSSKDVLKLKLPMEAREERLPDNSSWVSFSYGPIVLAAKTSNDDLKGLFADDSRMGHVATGKMIPLELSPILKAENRPIPLKQENGLSFLLAANDFHHWENAIELVPFYTIHESRYQLYWPMSNVLDLDDLRNSLRIKDENILRIQEVTVDQIAVGEQQPEAEHDFNGDNTLTGQENGMFWRSTTSYFQYHLKDEKKEGKILRLTFLKPFEDQNLKISLNGKSLALDSAPLESDRLSLRDYVLPAFEGESLQIKIESLGGMMTPKLHHIRLMKTNN
jgi:uncharacterized protein